jgi:enamine deaminase RidA (YjgF/YER057c/UK114 family)
LILYIKIPTLAIINLKLLNMEYNPELRIKELGIILPPAPKPVGIYKPVLIVDNLLYVSGHGPFKSDGTLITGRVGADLDIEEGKQAARQVGLAMLASIKSHIGDLNKIKRIIKVLGMVNSVPGFDKHPAVINGFSELIAELYGDENGIGVRSAVGMMLPSNIAVEIEAVFELNH